MRGRCAETSAVHGNVHVCVLVHILEEPLVAFNEATATFSKACAKRVARVVCGGYQDPNGHPHAADKGDGERAKQQRPEVMLQGYAVPMDDAPSSSASVASPLAVFKPPQLNGVCHDELRHCCAQLHDPGRHECVVCHKQNECAVELEECLLCEVNRISDVAARQQQQQASQQRNKEGNSANQGKQWLDHKRGNSEDALAGLLQTLSGHDDQLPFAECHHEAQH
mmetsp:Transcript_37114/g.103288  ORF Transcript_37114/g.103288 Transcript_37114/m.103288 type:complete len:224 (-) Transcript_37114:831-1502(-)